MMLASRFCKQTGIFVTGSTLAVSAMYIMRTITRSQSTKSLIVAERNKLPGLVDLALATVFQRKIRDVTSTSKDISEAKLKVLVENFQYTEDEKQQFIRLSGNNANNLRHMFPHALGQRNLLALISHTYFPFKVLGALHKQSFFEIKNLSLLDTFCQSPPLPNIYAMEASFYGGIPGKKKGSEIVVSLSLIHRPTDQIIWLETLVWFTTQSCPVHDPIASQLLSKYNGLVDFTNLTSSKLMNSLIPHAYETRQFGWLTGDINPIHMHSLLAKLFGQQRDIAHGALVVGKALSLLANNNSNNNPFAEDVMQFAISFKGPVNCESIVQMMSSSSSCSISSSSNNNNSDSTGGGEGVDLICQGQDRPSITLRVF
jgi:hypothetical protein